MDVWIQSDVFEHGEFLEIEMELPGIRADEVELRIESHLLTLQVKPARSRLEGGRLYHRRERSRKECGRDLPLPHAVRRESALATLRDGLLRIRLECLSDCSDSMASRIPVAEGIDLAAEGE